LTAVAPGAQGKGVGRRIWRSVLMLHKAQGIETVETCVSGHNDRVLNLYATLGFRVSGAEMTFHWIRGQ
jgi:ribosomal protein S18 acetylase RimI-like enzyme